MNEHLDAATPARAAVRYLRIEFTGSGSEYFRIWIVNLLLSLVTLGLYLPFAKARRLSYFYANTRVDGQALSFHGDPWRMFRGFVLLVLLMGAYGVAGRFSPTAGFIAFLLLCGLWPALWRSSLRFRLGNSSWRGLRFSFHGDVASAYKAMLPLYVPSMILLLPQLLLDGTPENGLWQGIFAGTGFLAMLLLFPWALAQIKRYQHGGYAYAAQRGSLDVPTRRFYALGLKGLLMSLLPAFVFGVLAAVLIPALRGTGVGPGAGMAVLGLGIALLYLLWFVLAGSYFGARLQNLVWNGTHSAELRFDSGLSFRALAWLTLKNWLLTAVTLSLYRPFAAVNTARLRLEAVSVRVDGDIDAWLAQHSANEQDASGDAAGDFFGIDMGL